MGMILRHLTGRKYLACAFALILVIRILFAWGAYGVMMSPRRKRSAGGFATVPL